MQRVLKLFSVCSLLTAINIPILSQNLIRNSSFDEVRPYSHGINASQQKKHFTENTRFWNTPTGGTPDIWLEEYRSDPKIGRRMEPLKPRTGESMIGIRIYGCHKVFGSHCREYIQTKTKEPIKAGQCYEYEFYALSKVETVRINGIGLGLSELQHNDLTNQVTLDLEYVFQEEEIVHEGVGKWCQVSGSFTAEKDFNHIIIGNFSDDENTKTIKFDNGSNEAYYFIDDVSLYKVDCNSGSKLQLASDFTLDDISFAYNSAVVTSKAKEALRKFCAQIQEDSPESILINGYCDDSGTDVYNMNLSQKRAENVMRLMEMYGLPKNKMKAIGHGSSNPLDLQNKAKNRRVEIVIE